MKPTINRKPKPRISRKKLVTETQAQHRARKYLAERNLIAIRRQLAPCGPIFVVNMTTGRVVAKHLADQRELAAHYGLVKPWERAS